ncbi:MAG: hypothetical protein ACOXZ5_05490 [Syntrophomonadaceae bacterium]
MEHLNLMKIPDTKEMYLDAVFPGINPEQVKELVEWDLKISPNLAVVETSY